MDPIKSSKVDVFRGKGAPPKKNQMRMDVPARNFGSMVRINGLFHVISPTYKSRNIGGMAH